jgi:hypothetical protein
VVTTAASDGDSATTLIFHKRRDGHTLDVTFSPNGALTPA